MKLVSRIFPKQWTETTLHRLLGIGIVLYEAVTAPVFIASLSTEPHFKFLDALFWLLVIRHTILLWEVLFAILALGIYLAIWSAYFSRQDDKTITHKHQIAIIQGFIGLAAPACYFYWFAECENSQWTVAVLSLFPTISFGMISGTAIGLMVSGINQTIQSESTNVVNLVIASALTILLVLAFNQMIWEFLLLWELE